jgi:hypothetical protein
MPDSNLSKDEVKSIREMAHKYIQLSYVNSEFNPGSILKHQKKITSDLLDIYFEDNPDQDFLRAKSGKAVKEVIRQVIEEESTRVKTPIASLEKEFANIKHLKTEIAEADEVIAARQAGDKAMTALANKRIADPAYKPAKHKKDAEKRKDSIYAEIIHSDISELQEKVRQVTKELQELKKLKKIVDKSDPKYIIGGAYWSDPVDNKKLAEQQAAKKLDDELNKKLDEEAAHKQTEIIEIDLDELQKAIKNFKNPLALRTAVEKLAEEASKLVPARLGNGHPLIHSFSLKKEGLVDQSVSGAELKQGMTYRRYGGQHAGGITMGTKNNIIYFEHGGDCKFTGVIFVDRISNDGKLLKDQRDMIIFEEGNPIAFVPAEKGKTRLGQNFEAMVKGKTQDAPGHFVNMVTNRAPTTRTI